MEYMNVDGKADGQGRLYDKRGRLTHLLFYKKGMLVKKEAQINSTRTSFNQQHSIDKK